MGVALNEEHDRPRWKRTKTGKFTVEFMYNHVSNNGIDRSFKYLWKARISLRIKNLVIASMTR